MCPIRQALALTLVAVAVTTTSTVGQQILLRQGDGTTAQLSISMSTGDVITSPAKTPHAEEDKILGIMRRDTHRRKEAIEAEVLLQADIATALAAAKKAMAAFSDALGNNEDYALLQEEKADLNEERQGLYRSGAGMDQKERRRKHKELSEKLKALSKEIAEFAEATPEIRALTEPKAKAIEAFITAFEAACKAHPKWAALQDDIDDVKDWSRRAHEQRGGHRLQGINWR